MREIIPGTGQPVALDHEILTLRLQIAKQALFEPALAGSALAGPGLVYLTRGLHERQAELERHDQAAPDESST